VALTSTDRAGYYQLRLAPGTYVIAVTYPGLRPSPLEKTVAVSAGPLHTLNFVLDTGIR
jgi:Carboxypeptidase regulatory-like domain